MPKRVIAEKNKARRRMAACWGLVAFFAALALCADAAAQVTGRDELVMADRSRRRNVTVLEENWDVVKVDTTGNGQADLELPVTQVTRVEYADTPAAWRNAETHLRAGRFSEAARQYENALQAQGVRRGWIEPQGWFNLGRCNLEMGRADREKLDAAISNFNNVIEKYPRARAVPGSRSSLAEAFKILGRMDEAEAELRKLESGEYGVDWQRRARLELASLMADKKNRDDALAFAKGALELAEASGQEDLIFEARVTNAEILARVGGGAEAYEQLRVMANDTPEHAVARKARIFNAMGDSLMAQDRVHEAILAYLRVQVLYFDAADELPRSMLGAALGFRAQRQGDRARGLARELMEKFPESKWAHMARQEFPDVR